MLILYIPHLSKITTITIMHIIKYLSLIQSKFLIQDGEHKYGPSYPRTDIEVTGEQIASGVPGALQVRRGSEPALNQLPVGPPAPADPTKRWSAAPLILEPPSTTYLTPNWANDSREEDGEPGFRRIARDGSNRLSMQFLGDGGG